LLRQVKKHASWQLAATGSIRMSRRSRHHGDGGGGVALALIITPMLDMSFQILSFFIMTYHPSALEGHINGALVPPTKTAVHGKESNKPEENLLPDTEPELEASLSVLVKAVPKGGPNEHERSDGQPTAIYIKNKEDTEATLVADDGDPNIEASLRKLTARLKSVLTAGGNTAAMKGNIRLDCQGDLKHQYVMQIYDACKQSGFQNVAFVAPPPDRKKD
jgi:biopolymer transport protein ExbD